MAGVDAISLEIEVDFSKVFDSFKVLRKREIDLINAVDLEAEFGVDDVLCVALPRNTEKCFRQILGTTGRISFIDIDAIKSAKVFEKFSSVGTLVLNKMILEDHLDLIETLRSKKTVVYVACGGVLNDYLRPYDGCQPVDFWSGRLLRVPDGGDLRGGESDWQVEGSSGSFVLAEFKETDNRERELATRLQGLVSQSISLSSGLARSHATSYQDILGCLLPDDLEFDLVVLSKWDSQDENKSRRANTVSQLERSGHQRKLLILDNGCPEAANGLDQYSFVAMPNYYLLKNVPPAAFYSAANSVYADNLHLCAEARLYGKQAIELKNASEGVADSHELPAEIVYAVQLLETGTYFFDCAREEFISPETLLGRLADINLVEPVEEIGSHITAETADNWAERAAVLGRAGYINSATAVSSDLSPFFPGTNIFAGVVHGELVLKYLNGSYSDLEHRLSNLDNPENFERVLPIVLYSLFHLGMFDEIEKISAAYVRQATELIIENPSAENLKRFEKGLNCLYELDQLLSSFGKSCMNDTECVVVADCIASLFCSWGKLWRKQRAAASSLSRSAIKVLHREDFNIPDALVRLLVRKNKQSLMFLVSLLNLLNNNEIITEKNMTGRQRIMAELGEHACNEFLRQHKVRKLDPVYWANLMSLVALGYDCNVLRTEKFLKLESQLKTHLHGGPSLIEGVLLKLGIARLMSGYIRALEQLAVANSPVSKLACDFLQDVIQFAEKKFKSHPTIQQDLLRVYMRLRDSDAVEKKLVAVKQRKFAPNAHVQRMFSEHLFARAKMEEGLDRLKQGEIFLRTNLLKNGDNPLLFKQLNDLSNDLARKKFYQSGADLLSAFPQPRNPKGVVFVLPYDAQNTMAMGVPVMGELRKQGYATIYLGTGILPKDPTGIAEIDRYHGIVSYDYTTLSDEAYYDRTLKNEWKIDWKNKVLECEGVNYFQGVFEYLANRYRRFDIDIEKPPIQKFFYTQLLKCDRAVTICKDMQANSALDGLPVRFMAVSAQTSPSYIYKEFCAEVGYKHDMHLVFHINGYENYFSNLGTKVASTMGVRDMTVRPFIRSPLIVRRDMLELPTDGEVEKERLKSVLTADRVGVVGATPHVAFVEKRIREHRAKGGKVIVCYGKVLCDLGVPYDGGPAHRDILDWVNHTIESARKSKALVLIKPHPHEMRPEIARHLTQTLFEGITVEIPDNVILLGHDWFNNSRLKDMMDVAILWNGTSCLEMSVWGLPVVICAHFGVIDYPVNLIAPKSRADYEHIICAPESLKQHPDSAGLAIDYLQKMGGESVFLPYRYCPRPATNDPVGPYFWIEEDIEMWRRAGDPSVKKMAEEYFRCFKEGERGVATESDYELYRSYKHGYGTAI